MYMRGVLTLVQCAALLRIGPNSPFAVHSSGDDGRCSASTWIPQMSINASRRVGRRRVAILERVAPRYWTILL